MYKNLQFDSAEKKHIMLSSGNIISLYERGNGEWTHYKMDEEVDLIFLYYNSSIGIAFKSGLIIKDFHSWRTDQSEEKKKERVETLPGKDF